MPIRPIGQGVAAVMAASMIIAASVAASPALAAAAAGSGSGNGSWPALAEIATPSGEREVAERQAAGCALLGLGVTGLAVASGALTAAGTGGAGAAPVGAALGEVVAYFGAGCTIGAFLSALPLFGYAPADASGESGTAVKGGPPPRLDGDRILTDAQPAALR
ncbi:hypothetical protein TSH100_03690 [Azospirillum sp. TSH100]|uniref:hypothetical protein n=1 Tax=Azospirillum sp. TSH100 TaxID=652764 RepID=UPI000D6166A7|nr:hypothetical protein [Azospirillum sp. TSH100]PWC90096.1 hypothetical protein TSH100_03690 [Azospirillum sp. TSH100]QCG90660.1 hypothetical protein E6C72_23010 [Azospirillum sp. TSH100]